MARARTIKPGFFTNDDLGQLKPAVRLLFAGLWTMADREGRLIDRPVKIKAEVLPYDHVDVVQALGELAERGFILRYAAAGLACIQIAKWGKHQRPHPRETASELPPPPAIPKPDPGTPQGRPQDVSQVVPEADLGDPTMQTQVGMHENLVRARTGPTSSHSLQSVPSVLPSFRPSDSVPAEVAQRLAQPPIPERRTTKRTDERTNGQTM